MSQQLLDQIITIGNVVTASLVASLLQVRSDSDHSCCICLQEIGTLSPETGIIEHETRLPRSHLIGSACIARWLNSNNTCPVCRQEFFPAESQPDLEYDDMPAIQYDDEEIGTICSIFCDELRFSYEAETAAMEVAEMLEALDWLLDHTPQHIAATAVYMVLHIMGQAATIEEISEVCGISEDHIKSSYRLIHPNRKQLVRPYMLIYVSRESTEKILAFLPALRPEDGFIDLEGDDDAMDMGSDLEYHLMPPRREQLDELCDRCCKELGYEQGAIGMCQNFALKISHGSCLPGQSSLPIAGLSLYMVNHLVDLGTALRQISDVVGVSESMIRDSYERVYHHRGQLVSRQTLVDLASRNLERALQVLDWPAI